MACWDALQPLFVAHHAERGDTFSLLPLEVDMAMYAKYEAAGALVVVTLRTAHGLCGYTLSYVLPHPHAATARCAYMDAYYVAPVHRESDAARGLMAETERVWQARGVCRAYVAVPDKVLGRWMRRQGWQEYETIYSKDM